MVIITVGQRKGGSGKTITTWNLGAGLKSQGRRVLLIDLDSQCSLTRNLRINPNSTIASAYEVLTGSVLAKDTIVETGSGDLIPASSRLATADLNITGRGKEYRLQNALRTISDQYDVCIADTPPALGILLVNALTASDSLLITAQARQSSLDGIRELYGTIDAVRRATNPKLRITGIVITMTKPRTLLTRDMRENLSQIAESLQTEVLQSEIRDCNALAEIESVRSNIFDYAPRSNGAQDYAELTAEILRKENDI